MSTTSKVFTKENLDYVNSLIGKELRVGQIFNEVATKDAIRHFAEGYGDVNPLCTDEEYAARTRWGGIIAPPTFLFSCRPGRSTSLGFRGSHSLWAENAWEWYEPIPVNEPIKIENRLLDCFEVKGGFASPMYEQKSEIVYRGSKGKILAREINRNWAFERFASKKRDRYESVTRQKYTPEEIQKIYADYDKEVIRGATPRYWEEVEVGEDLPFIVKGPLTITDIIAFKIGCGSHPFVRAHRIRVEYERRHPSTAVPNSWGIPDVPERVHYEDELAQKIGMPAAFDYGYQRVAWLAQVITNWMGDDGFLKSLSTRIRRPNLLNDTTWCHGKVVKKEILSGEHIVECELYAKNQRDVITAKATARVLLPSHQR